MSFTDLSPQRLSEMIKNKSKEDLADYGGLEGLAGKIGTDLHNGLTGDDLIARKAHFGENVFPEPPHQNFFQLWWEAIKDLTLIILIVAAVVSLVLGCIPDLSSKAADQCINVTDADEKIGEKQAGWIEGAAILLAVLLVSTVTAGQDYSKELRFRALAAKEKRDRQVKVVRHGKPETVPFAELCAGDIVTLDTGDQIPGDGLYIKGFDLKLDESQMTGEPLPAKKNVEHPHMLSGCKVTDGSGYMLVCCVGSNTEWGRTMASLEEEKRDTPLQENLDELAGMIGKVGMGVAALVFVVLFFWWLIPAVTYDCEWVLKTDHCVHAPANMTETEKDLYTCLGYNWRQTVVLVDYFIIAVTIIVVAVPEGLPLAVTISLAYSMKQMYADNNLVRHLKACETMSNCTNICSDKTGTLTENCMTVVRGWIAGKPFEVVPPSFVISDSIRHLLIENISINSAYSSNFSKEEGKPAETVGNKTECALLMFAAAIGANYSEVREKNVNNIYQRFSFSSARKRMNTLVWLNKAERLVRMYSKGAPEIVLRRCSAVLTMDGEVIELTPEIRENLLNEVQEYANRGLRTLCLAYRDMPAADPSKAVDPASIGEETEEGQETDLNAPIPVIMDTEANEAVFGKAPDLNQIVYAVVGIHDPVRKEVPEAVLACQKAGIVVRMVTGDNIITAKHIAEECHILTPGGVAIEGPEFDKLSDQQVDELLPNLQVLARSAPSDKRRLVRRLIENGEVVAVTGDGTNDVQALKEADVGMAMGLRGTDIAKQASDIVILDDNFKSIVKAVMWGRSVYDNIRKFLQFQLTVNVVALAIVAIGAVTQKGACLKAIQLLWVNMIMDTMAALALGTEKPTPALLERKPFGRYDRLISNLMIRNILIHATYQLGLLLVLLYCGNMIGFLGVPCAYAEMNDPLSPTPTTTCCIDNYDSTETFFECPGNPNKHLAYDWEITEQTAVLQTVIFNTFVFCQVFNEINSRKVNNEWNVYEKIWTNWMFGLIVLVTVVFQTLIVTCAGEWMGVAPRPGLNWIQWVACLVPAVLTLPIGLCQTFIPVPVYTPRKFKGNERTCFGLCKKKQEPTPAKDAELDLLEHN